MLIFFWRPALLTRLPFGAKPFDYLAKGSASTVQRVQRCMPQSAQQALFAINIGPWLQWQQNQLSLPPIVSKVRCLLIWKILGSVEESYLCRLIANTMREVMMMMCFWKESWKGFRGGYICCLAFYFHARGCARHTAHPQGSSVVPSLIRFLASESKRTAKDYPWLYSIINVATLGKCCGRSGLRTARSSGNDSLFPNYWNSMEYYREAHKHRPPLWPWSKQSRS